MEEPQKTVLIEAGTERMTLALDLEGGRYATTIILNGVPCHLEAMDVDRFVESCKADDDPDYVPKLDQQGHAFLLLPFAR